jgi:hypothetical protein
LLVSALRMPRHRGMRQASEQKSIVSADLRLTEGSEICST